MLADAGQQTGEMVGANFSCARVSFRILRVVGFLFLKNLTLSQQVSMARRSATRTSRSPSQSVSPSEYAARASLLTW